MADVMSSGAAAGPDRAAIVASIAARKRRHTISVIVVAVAVVAEIAILVVTGAFRFMYGMPAALAVFVTIGIQSVYAGRNSRCPVCDTALSAVIGWAKFCPGCGTQLVPDERIAGRSAPSAGESRR